MSNKIYRMTLPIVGGLLVDVSDSSPAHTISLLTQSHAFLSTQ